MEQLIQAFGIDAKGIIIQIFNFVVLTTILAYFLYNPVLNLLREREERISQGLKDAEAAKAAKEAAEDEKRRILTRANQEADEVAVRAKQHAQEQATEIVSTAEVRAESVIKDAEIKSEEIKDRARKESEAEVAKLAILAAEKVLRKEA